MKKLILLPVIALIAIPAFAASTQTTTTRTYDSTTTSPMYDSNAVQPSMGTQSEEERVYDNNSLTTDELEQERMEERQNQLDREDKMYRQSRVSPDGVDYWDRTRTNRERKALNTGSDASDDQ